MLIFLIICSLLAYQFTYYVESETTDLGCEFTKIWGPGLNPVKIVTPVRYFFIQTYNTNGTKLNESPKPGSIKILAQGSETSCKLRTDLLNRQDGSFIFRYRLFAPCPKLQITVMCNEKHIHKSPFISEYTVYPDVCSCDREDNIDQWIQKYDCPKIDGNNQISKDLNVFNNIMFDDVLEAAEENIFKRKRQTSVCHYVIKNNVIYRKCYGEYTDFKMFSDSILLFLTNRVNIPDVEFFWNLGDWPIITGNEKMNGKKVLIPMFSWCGSKDTYDIVLPTYDITESSIENLGRVTLDILSVQGNSALPWKYKNKKLFWRGRDSNRNRLKLVSIARQYPDLMNVSLTDFFFFRDLESEYGPKEKRISFFSFFDYKYQLNVDGTVAAYRFPYLLAGNSVSFKQKSKYYEFFYNQLEEWKHFIPIEEDLTDIVEKLQWAIKHDTEAALIANNAREFVNTHLLPHHIFCYHIQALNAFRRKFENISINVRPGMTKVTQDVKVNCDCSYKSNQRNEL